MKYIFWRFKRVVMWLCEGIFPASTLRKGLADINPSLLSRCPPATTDSVLTSCNSSAVFAYRDPLVRSVIHAYKYDRATELAEVFADILADSLHEQLSEDVLFGRTLKPALLVPVPISEKKRFVRGFNQTELLAKKLVERLGTVVRYAPCVERYETRNAQAKTIGRKSRLQNVEGCFRMRNGSKVLGEYIIVIDDVITSGATMHEMRRVFLAAGARDVRGIAIAH